MIKYILFLGLLLTSCGQLPQGERGPSGNQGESGPQGNPGIPYPQTGWEIVKVQNPCNDFRKGSEQLIFFANGGILSSISQDLQGNYTRNGLLFPGTFITSDGYNCKFTIGLITSKLTIINSYY